MNSTVQPASTERSNDKPSLNPNPATPLHWDTLLRDQDRFCAPSRAETFHNPIISTPSADPWVVQHQGSYYYCESRQQHSIHVRKAKCLTEIGLDDGEQVWAAPMVGGNSKAVWAPELHRIGNKWYIYYAADDGLNENHRMWVLESLSDNPQGAYRCRGMLETDGWAIDGTVLAMENGQLYFIWSGWPGRVNGEQNLYIAPMSNPWTLSATRSLLATPTRDWESVDMPICEGPQVLKNNGRIFLIYSASGSWTVDYCLGMLAFQGGDPLDAGNWTNRGQVLKRTNDVLGTGHCSFTTSPDGRENWILYHTKTKYKKGWNDRNVHAQPFTWTEDGYPYFGTPIAAGVPIGKPSGMQPVLAAA